MAEKFPLSFGTDGARGVANKELNFKSISALVLAFIKVIKPQKCFVACDTRISSLPFKNLVLALLAMNEVEAIDLGISTTPCASYLCMSNGIFGIVVSASHNPYEYNGIKIFNRNGEKLERDFEKNIEAKAGQIYSEDLNHYLPSGLSFAKIVEGSSFISKYENFLSSNAKIRERKVAKVALDLANGAAYRIAPNVFSKLGYEITCVNDHPDGYNINLNCGATAPFNLRSTVLNSGAQVGFAFDGDADRLICIDEHGEVVDGDDLIGIFASQLFLEDKELFSRVVVTILSNWGLKEALEKQGIEVILSDVGDRNVYRKMQETNSALGGEQSGHIIRSDIMPTGDALLNSIMLLDILNKTGKSLNSLKSLFSQKYAQCCLNIKISNKGRFDSDSDNLKRAIEFGNDLLRGEGRVVIRLSGTEPVLRLMVEAKTFELAKFVINKLEEEVSALDFNS